MEKQWLGNRANNRWSKDRIYRPWKEIVVCRWHPKLETKFSLTASIYGNNNMEIYFVYNSESLLITKAGHYGDSPATLIIDYISYNIDNEEIDISNLNYYMIEDDEGNIDPEIDYKAFFPALEE